jgi:hypothetical protein
MFTRREHLKQLSTFGLTALAGEQPPANPAISIKDDRPTVLMGAAASLSGPLRTRPNTTGFDMFHVSNWTQTSDSFTWTLDVPAGGQYGAVALIRGTGATIQLVDNSRAPLTARVDSGWNRVSLGNLQLVRGTQTLTLSAPRAGSGLELYSLELTAPPLAERLLAEARAMHSDTAWMRRAKYGLQFHWTSQSQPRTGPKKPYADAARDFPARAFAETVHEAGAGYVILTTSHAEYYFPAPIAAIDATMPGRTAHRDLVHDLIDELGRYGIRLMLYYHPGHDDWRDPNGWWARTGYDPRSPEKFLNNWCSIVSEVGSRYGEGLAGWFFDDGRVYYPLNSDFRRLTTAAKTGNPRRLVCYNPWIYPRMTDFQDYFCGEGYSFLKVRDHLPADGSGVFIDGPQKGLQAHTNFILESDWCHSKPETAIPSPGLVKETFVADVTAAIARGIVPSINLEIYQDGGVSPVSLDYLKALKASVSGDKFIE